MEARICFCGDWQKAPPLDMRCMPKKKFNQHLFIEKKSKRNNMTKHFTVATEEEMKKNLARQRAKQFKGSIAEPRTFVKPGTYSGEELKRRWRTTMWDDVPSMMAGQRHYRVSK